MYKIILDGSIIIEDILSASASLEVNKVGTVKFQIAATNPAYKLFKKLKSEISVLDSHGEIIFDGRVLNIGEDFYNNRTILCESSFSYLNDSVALVYEHKGTLNEYIRKLLDFHNAQVEDNRKIYPGTITVEDPNNYVNYSDMNAPSIMELINNKVIKKYGGYMLIRKQAGKNYLDYLAEIPYRLQQEIKLGVNLMDLAKESTGGEIYTVVYPTGARKQTAAEEGATTPGEEGPPITIESVNDGSPFVESKEAIAKFGRIIKHISYDNVTEPMNLKNKAIKDLGQGVLDLESISIKAVDTSVLGDIDSFKLLKWVKVESSIHGVAQHYLIEKLSLDFLHPENNAITIGGMRERLSEVLESKYEEKIKPIANASEEAKRQVGELEQKAKSLIEQTKSSIIGMVSNTYVSKSENEKVVEALSTRVEQTATALQINFNSFKQDLEGLAEGTAAKFSDISEYIRFEHGEIELGKRGNRFKLKLGREKVAFYDSGAEVAYLSNNRLYVTDGEFINSLILGKFAFLPRKNGNLSFVKVVN